MYSTDLHYFKVDQTVQRRDLTGERISREISTGMFESINFDRSYKLTNTQVGACERGSRTMFQRSYYEQDCCTMRLSQREARATNLHSLGTLQTE